MQIKITSGESAAVVNTEGAQLNSLKKTAGNISGREIRLTGRDRRRCVSPLSGYCLTERLRLSANSAV